jgi:hypothetical protein
VTTLLNGLLGGLLIGLVAGFVTRFVENDPSATAMILNRLIGDSTTTSRWWELVGHVLYGGFAGGVLVALELFAFGVLAVPPALGEALGVAIAWSALLFVLWAVVLRVGSSLPAGSSLRALVVYHLVYGIGLGLWIRVTWIT